MAPRGPAHDAAAVGGRSDATAGPGRVLAAVAAVGASYLAVHSGRGDVLDRTARDVLARPLGVRADVAVGAITDLGSVYGLAGIATALAVTGRARAASDTVAAGGAAWVLAQAMKPALHRPRPYQLDAAARLVAVPAGSSWPSGHAAVAGATATALHPHLSRRGRIGAWTLVGGVALSRLYVGVHHLTDVVAGVGVGVASATVTSRVGGMVRAARRRRQT